MRYFLVHPQEPYAEHYKETGYNAVFFFGAAHSWARQLRIVNADYGIGLDHAHFCTVEDVQLSTDFKRDTMSTGVCITLPPLSHMLGKQEGVILLITYMYRYLL